MWALVESDNVTQVYTRPKGLTIGDVNYPSNIFMLWSSSELEAIGIYEIVIDNSNLKNQEYYINTNQTFAFADGVVTASYGTATAKAIADTLYTAQDVTDDVYPEGHADAGDRINTWSEGDVKTPGLKTNYKATINQQAGGLLQDTDWMIVRAAEGGTAVPSDITTWRAAVRTKANAMQVQIEGAADVDALAALYVYNDSTPPVRPLGEFPTLG
jgi:hypothetical protein